MTDLTFRIADITDLPVILALLADDDINNAREGDPNDPRYRAAFDEIHADPRNELIVAEVDSQVVGTCQLTYIPSLSRTGSQRMTIEAVRIDPTWRGRALGTQLIKWTLDRARDRGCRIVQLTTDKRRADAHRFYETLGFTASHEGFKLTV